MRRGTACIAMALAACTGHAGDTPGTDSGTAGTAGDGAGDAPDFSNPVGPYFTTQMFFNRDVSAAPKAANSASIISALRAAGGWGNGDNFAIDFSIDVLHSDASTPLRTFTTTGDFY